MALFLAYDHKKMTKDMVDPSPRYDSFEKLNEAGGKKWTSIDDAPDSLIANITESKNLRVALGIVTGEGGKVPSTEGVPRMFIIGKDENGADKVMTLEEAGAPAGSREFWKQAQLGNLFAYAAGEKDPVQVKLNVTGVVTNLKISKPIDPENFPTGPVPKRPGFFQRLLHGINKNWASGETRSYYKKTAEAKALKESVRSMTKSRKNSIDSEMKELRSQETVIEAAVKKQNIAVHAADMKAALEEKKNGLQTFRDITAPTPVFNEKIEKVTEASEGRKEKAGLYTKEQFKILKTIDADVSSFKIGEKTVSEQEYMGLVAAATLAPKYAEKMIANSATKDLTLFQTLENMGIPKEQVHKNYCLQHSDWLFGDFMKIKGLRDGETNLFDPVLNPARQDAIDLLRDYQAGKEGSKKALAENISRGITHIMNTVKGRKSFSDMTMKQFRVMNSLAGLLDRDPELKAIAMKEPPEGCGVTEKDLKMVRGMAEIDKADLKAAESASKLAEAALEGAEPLSAEEKKQLTADVISSKLMQAKLFADIAAIDKDEAHSAVYAKSQEAGLEAAMNGRMVTMPMTEEWNAHPESRPLPPKGKLFSDQVLEYTNALLPEIKSYPETAISLAENGQQNYKDLALAIVEKEGYASLSPDEIGKKLVGDKCEISDSQLVEQGAKVLADRQKPAEAAADAPEVNKNAAKDEEIKNEQPAGPQP